MLMDACGCDLPDEGRRADVSGRGLVSTVREDLTFFLRLTAVDAGDNSLSFDSFVDLPRLEELRLPCNSIRDIDFSKLLRQQQQLLVENGSNGGGGGGYTELRRLDLSYNCLSGDALCALVRLPNLTDLDLTCNGLTNLPGTMGRFPQLQKLSLERNQLESDTVFEVLSELTALRELNLAFNYFTGVNLKPENVECAFPLLEGLDLGFNYIGSERDVSVLVLLDRLQRVVLYGNPLAGPTGEDSLGLCVENLIAESDRVRGEYAGYPIEVITELPRTKQSQGPATAGQGGGGSTGRRRRPYGDMGVTMVDEGCLPPAAAFRDAGNRSLFQEDKTSFAGGGREDEIPNDALAADEAQLHAYRGESGPVGRGEIRVDEVLTSMGAGMDAMVLEKRARQRSSCTGAKPGRPELSSIIRTVNAVLDENEY
ncbi:unnamed protein product [Scytosiphon promiscuus]